MQSEQINELAEALAKAQGEVSIAHKDTRNDFHRSNYADLASCWDACRDALSKNGLAVIQYPGNSDQGFLNLITMLSHSSGQWIKGSIKMKLQTRKKDKGWVDATDPQTYGITMTYARRYGLMAMVSIAPGDSDCEPPKSSNAGVASKKVHTEKEYSALNKPIPPQDDIPIGTPPVPTNGSVITPKQATDFRKKCSSLKIPTAKAKAMLKEHDIKTVDDIPPHQYEHHLKGLEFLAQEIAGNGKAVSA